MKWLIVLPLLVCTLGCSTSRSRSTPASAKPLEPAIILDDISVPVDPARVGLEPGLRRNGVSTPATYTVRQGDTLFSLARRFYHDPSKWRLLASANRNVIPNPNIVRVGTRIVIPGR